MAKKVLKPYADLSVKIREYEKDGETKPVWQKVGVLFASPHLSHMFISLDAIPVSKDWDGAIGVFKRDDAEQAVEKEKPKGSQVKDEELTDLEDIKL